MRYYDLLERLSEEKVKDIQSLLLQGGKNAKVKMLRDYYNGKQWLYNALMTDTTRSGKKVWNIHKKNINDMGINDGDLQVYNVCDTTVNIYSSYGRGNINEDNRIQIDENDSLAQEINDKINLDLIISRVLTRGCVDSITVLKFQEDKSLDLIDTIQIFPIYDGDDRVGTIRIYEISKNDPIIANNPEIHIKKNEVALYTEVWYPLNGKMWLTKFVNQYQIEDGKAPFEFDPHIYISNKDNEFVKFDENNIEVSDVDRLINMQDALNKTLTEEGIIISKVAFPIIKVIKEVYDKMADGTINAEQLKKDLAEVSLVAGKIIAAPIEREGGQDLPSGVDKYVDGIFTHVYRITGIPKGVFVSEGMSGISEKTMSAMMESLKRRVDEKRANIEQGIREYVAMYTGNPEIKDSVHIQWAEMFAMSKEEQSNILLDSFKANLIPQEYALHEIMEILGDGEEFDEVWAKIMENDMGLKLSVEKERISRDAQRQIEAKEKELSAEKEKRVQKEIENTLLSKEVEDITSGL